MKNDYKIVTYNNKNYIVSYTQKNEPFVFDQEDFQNISNLNYYLTNVGYICCRSHIPLYLHHQIIKDYKFNGTYIDHINRIKTDNRKVNLRLISQSDQNKNQSKRKRNVILPESCNINPNDIPTFIWYIKESKTHGDRWMVEIKGKYTWKTTSSKMVSTKCKFELAKKHLRNLIINNPKLFHGHSMNGELSELGKILENEYIEILKICGFNHKSNNQNTKDLLKENIDDLNDNELVILRQA